MARFAALVYRRGVVRTGERVKLRDVLRPKHPAAERSARRRRPRRPPSGWGTAPSRGARARRNHRSR
ncbi:MAG: hypothetical protein WCG47_26790, partial [Dermatophilaceae bacterium]